ncbi:hypothetical protein ACFRJ3_35020 [Streptomyces sp. NPDC056696]|uniref:hypothetical protein n=1 Tax=Streptomyces sp. NPDC056696 TaxID=3345914 RepID=UPI0036AE75BC
MFDLNRDKVIVAKPVRRKAFVLGKSVALVRKEVVITDDGVIRVVAYRRPEFWDYNPKTPLVVGFAITNRGADFGQVVQRVREMESQFITAELPESC